MAGFIFLFCVVLFCFVFYAFRSQIPALQRSVRHKQSATLTATTLRTVPSHAAVNSPVPLGINAEQSLFSTHLPCCVSKEAVATVTLDTV